ncbi:MAG: class I SAM-dependent methyltransferase [Eubacterium sp.]|nr:class I SAM-dependent methyltransferase [Eubacterium sp.]
MDLRLKFNEDVINYDNIRPAYVDELYKDIFSYAQIDNKSSILEIGIGTGQATLPFLKKGCNITAIELGNNLAEYAKNKFSAYKNINIINKDFMNVLLQSNQFDFVYSATAFHWLPQEQAFNKIKEILKPNGTIALFWNHPFPNRLDDESNIASKAIYDKYRPTDKPITEFSEKDLLKYEKALELYGFTDIRSYMYRRTRTLSTDEYIALINTYSDHRALPADIKYSFETEMKNAINNIGGKINIYDTIDVYLAKNSSD